MTITALSTFVVDVTRSANDRHPEKVAVLAKHPADARRFACEAVRLRHDLPPSATLFASNARRAK